ncbi:MAG TPA: polyhydroxyalkanoate synthesis repressor PhaR, partial [Dyella sp.]|nr:polyhydroxyalkanoate synthesis repressor PhaR [Dyella sp.]
QQFRSQLNSLMGQTPWSLLNELTERNLDAWKSMQRGFLDTASQASNTSGQPAQPGRTAKKP